MTTREVLKGHTHAPKKTSAALAVRTDLNPAQIQQIIDAVDPLVADAFALYVKTKNFHWHLSGSHFRDYHLLFDEQADSVKGSIDRMAEGLRHVGGTTIHSISDICNLQTLSDDNDDFVAPGDMLRRLMDDNMRHAQMLRAAAEACEECREYSLSNTLQELLDETERRKWFLFETLQGIDNTR